MPQLTHGHIDVPLPSGEGLGAAVPGEHLPGHHFLGVAKKGCEQVKLLLREGDRFALNLQRPALHPEPCVSYELILEGTLRGPLAAQNHTNAGEEFSLIERFGDVVLGPEL
jgi:hypothetical protein